jgi:hypothetical protein
MTIPHCLPYNQWYIQEVLPLPYVSKKAVSTIMHTGTSWHGLRVGFDPYVYLLYGIKKISLYFI